MSSMTRMRPPGDEQAAALREDRAHVLVGEVVEEAEDQDLVEAGVGKVDLAGVGDDERALPGLARVIDVAGVQVHADVVVAGEEIGKGAGPAAEVERAQPLPHPQPAPDDGADGLEVVLEDAAEDDEQDRMVGDALDGRREEPHSPPVPAAQRDGV